MSCRKFEAPRHGSLAFCPRKRARSVKASPRAFPVDDVSKPCHLTAFFAYKAGMTHVVRMSERRKANERKAKSAAYEVLDPVTLLECPPANVFGVVGYKKTPFGLKRTAIHVDSNLSEGVIRRYNKHFNLHKQKGKMSQTSCNENSFNENDIRSNVAMSLETLIERSNDPTKANEDLNIIGQADEIRVLLHSNPQTIKCLNTKKVHVMEVKVNGGQIKDKIDWALEKLGKEISVNDVFEEQENIDILAVTKGKGFAGCPKRFGTTILPRKSNKGRRKVACIGAWHPSRVMWTVPRAGQLGFHRRTEINKRIYKIGNGEEPITTEYDITKKTINPMGGFKHYGNIKNNFVMVKGSIAGPRKRVITLRKSLSTKFNTKATEQIVLKFIDTSSKIGAGRFQTIEEKNAFYGIKKKKITQLAESAQ